MKRLFTSESVTEGHPDKICDQISDSSFRCYFSKGSKWQELLVKLAVTTGMVLVMGEISTNAMLIYLRLLEIQSKK